MLDLLRAKVSELVREAERRANIHLAAKEYERADRASAQVAALNVVIELIDALAATTPASRETP